MSKNKRDLFLNSAVPIQQHEHLPFAYHQWNFSDNNPFRGYCSFCVMGCETATNFERWTKQIRGLDPRIAFSVTSLLLEKRVLRGPFRDFSGRPTVLVSFLWVVLTFVFPFHQLLLSPRCFHIAVLILRILSKRKISDWATVYIVSMWHYLIATSPRWPSHPSRLLIALLI